MQRNKYSCTVPSEGSKAASQIIKLSGRQESVHRRDFSPFCSEPWYDFTAALKIHRPDIWHARAQNAAHMGIAELGCAKQNLLWNQGATTMGTQQPCL